MTTAWEHADVFPVIARIIETASVESGSAYVTHDQITSSLLADTEGSTLMSTARGELDEDRTAEWIAHNMVAWFRYSRRIPRVLPVIVKTISVFDLLQILNLHVPHRADANADR